MSMKKIIMIVGIIICALFAFITIWTIIYPTYNATITYTTEAIPAVEAVPAVEAKEAVYETSTTTMTYEDPPGYPEDDGEDLVQYTCGEELPLGEITYQMNFEEDSMYYIDVWDENGDFVASNFNDMIFIFGSGELLAPEEDTFTCKEGYSVHITWDDPGSITFTSSVLIKEAVPATEGIPAQPAIPGEEITEKLSYDSGTGTWTATSNGVQVEPNELKEYDKLKTDIENQMN